VSSCLSRSFAAGCGSLHQDNPYFMDYRQQLVCYVEVDRAKVEADVKE
jgi:hypothetical protein